MDHQTLYLFNFYYTRRLVQPIVDWSWLTLTLSRPRHRQHANLPTLCLTTRLHRILSFFLNPVDNDDEVVEVVGCRPERSHNTRWSPFPQLKVGRTEITRERQRESIVCVFSVTIDRQVNKLITFNTIAIYSNLESANYVVLFSSRPRS